MKEIKAIIQSSMLDRVLLALHSMKGLPGCTVSNVYGYQKSSGEPPEQALTPAERSKLEIVVKNADAKRVVSAIAENARTGSAGDGKIFVIECRDAVQVRTGKRGEQAL